MDKNLLQELGMREAAKLYNDLGLYSRQFGDFVASCDGPEFINPWTLAEIDRRKAAQALKSLADTIYPEGIE